KGSCMMCRRFLLVMKRCSKCGEAVYCSRECQKEHWPKHKSECNGSSACLVIHKTEDSLIGVTEKGKVCGRVLEIKHNKLKHTIKIPNHASGERSFGLISRHLRIPPEKLRLISKGKVVHKDNILTFLQENALFQAFGEQAECEDGLDPRDIEVLVAQLSVERNVAVRALRKTGELIDAILYISDNM
uniref:MYND-type domain-containing protein n=1 Tax=Latimeria chalumnae TaxID=7897 RepID=H3AWR2_LATCH